jgi:hypothetical protein
MPAGACDSTLARERLTVKVSRWSTALEPGMAQPGARLAVPW